jgi:uncharacterized membrane protein
MVVRSDQSRLRLCRCLLRNRGPTRPTRRSEGLTHDTIVHPDGSTPAPRGGTGKDRSSGCDRVLADIKERCPISAQCCVVCRHSRAHGIRSGLHIQTAGAQVSPNGRRRWRKACRRTRQREGSSYSAAVARRNCKRPGFDRELPPLPRPAFAARSLVGMSQSARKRAARKCLPSSTHAEECYKGTVAPHGKRAYVKWFHVPRCPIAKYRIGERLRPCPGWGCRLAMTTCIRCDGAGVEPARKARKVRG